MGQLSSAENRDLSKIAPELSHQWYRPALIDAAVVLG